MKSVLFGMSLIFGSVVTAQAATSTVEWNKKEIEALKGKTLYSVYCTKPKGFLTKDACSLNEKETSFKEFKLKTLVWISPTKIRIGDVQRTVEITQGPSLGVFTMNGRTINFNTSTPAEIRKQITSALPKVAVSIFMNAAFADEVQVDNIYVELRRAVVMLMSATTDEGRNKANQRIADLCGDGKNMAGTGELMEALKKYTATETLLERGKAAKKVLASLDNLYRILRDVEALNSRAYHYGETRSQWAVLYRGKDWDPGSMIHDCNVRLSHLKEDFDKTINDAHIPEQAKYADDEEVAQRLSEVLETMSPNDGDSLSPAAQEKLNNLQKTGRH